MLACSREFPASRIELDHHGRQLCLRPFALTDARELYAAIEETAQELRPFMPWAHLPRTPETQLRRIQAHLSCNAQGHDFTFGLFHENRMLACCGLHPRVPLNPNGFEIGFWTRSGETGQGLAKLMTRVLIVYAFEWLGIDRAQIAHNLENSRSQRVIESCGFVFEGVVRNELAPASAELLESGLVACRDARRYALVPEEARQLSWYEPTRQAMRLCNQFGEAV